MQYGYEWRVGVDAYVWTYNCTSAVDRPRKKPVKREKESDRAGDASSDDSDTERTADDDYSLPYSFAGKYKCIRSVKEINQLGFGAGGLPPLTFSHLGRNWCSFMGGRSASFGPSDESEEEEEEEGGGFFGPGSELSSLPWTDMHPGDSTDEEQGEDEGNLDLSQDGGGTLRDVQRGEGVGGRPPVRKRARSELTPRPATVRVPRSMVTRHSGGRGRKRFRHSKTQEGRHQSLQARVTITHTHIIPSY